MKIAFLIQDLFQLGAQYVTALMIRGFVAKGYNVDLVVSKVHQDLLEEGTIKPFEIPAKAKTIILPDRKAQNNIKAIRGYIKKNQPDAIVAMSTNYNFALAFAVLGLSRSVKRKTVIAYVEHSSFAGLDLNTMKSSRPRLFSKGWIMSSLLNHSFDVIMGVSAGTSQAIEYSQRRKPNSVVTVYNPVIDGFYWEKVKSEPSHPWIKVKTIPTLVAAGAHSSFKNHKCLFEAIRLANKKTPVRVVLFGKGKLTDNYRQWIDENSMNEFIMLSGHTDNLPAEIKAADAFIVSSDVESFSVVLVEALAAGTPIISTNCPFGPPELLKNGEYGTLVPVNNPQALADAIVEQIRNPRPAAPSEAWKPYTVENVVNAYEKALGFCR
ncbi:glycosyltransferase [Muribaculaceae bacterium Isolate-002 (NCI)]|nr:glycosyltransferase [Muribaculaceae bacterium Isolate-002 (NCI)]